MHLNPAIAALPSLSEPLHTTPTSCCSSSLWGRSHWLRMLSSESWQSSPGGLFISEAMCTGDQDMASEGQHVRAATPELQLCEQPRGEAAAPGSEASAGMLVSHVAVVVPMPSSAAVPRTLCWLYKAVCSRCSHYQRHYMLSIALSSAALHLQVVQPEGPSFQVDGHNVVWQQWHLHVGFNFREGLVLSHIGCDPQRRCDVVCCRPDASQVVLAHAGCTAACR